MTSRLACAWLKENCQIGFRCDGTSEPVRKRVEWLGWG
jgi:hypothetical protein